MTTFHTYKSWKTLASEELYTAIAQGFLMAIIFTALSGHSLTAQGCFNSDLETGTVDGYVTYIGDIDSEGTVTINTPGNDTSRHRVFHKSEGIDPIAAAFCIENKELPVVPVGGGQFALRLGNSDNGAQAERVVLNFTVTDDLTFFLLRYAVVINDPGHEDFEQPRFELRILDKNGDAFPCGIYQVRAGENIPGFENCGDWRVRPWTTAGIELKSFLGQEIQIEILTTDCSRGGHAGYAYLDATCQPLEIKLEGYCPGSTAAKMIVTDGFEKYEWNTGDSTNVIDIDNPVEGTPYHVTVTSSTGCQLILSDTIPEITTQPQPKFTQLGDTTVCQGERFWIHPRGEHLNAVYSLELDYQADSFLVVPFETRDYVFYANDLYSCKSDTLTYHVIVSNNEIDEVIDSTSCFGSSDGSIRLIDNPKAPFVSQSWDNGLSGMEINNLIAGRYSVVIMDSIGCTLTEKYTVHQPNKIQANFNVQDILCAGEKNGTVDANISGGQGPYSYKWQHTDLDAPSLTELDIGRYVLSISDKNGCNEIDSFSIIEPSPLVLSLAQEPASCANGFDGRAMSEISGGRPPYSYRWDDPSKQQSAIADELKSGIYELTITDRNQCAISENVTVLAPDPIEISLYTHGVSCHGGSDGKAAVEISGGTPSYQYSWPNSSNADNQPATKLAAGVQKIIVQDANGCTKEENIMVQEPEPISITPIEYIFPDCNDGRGSRTIISAEGGIGEFQYNWETGDLSDTVESTIGGFKIVEIIDGNGCLHIDSAEIKTPEISVSVDGLTNDLNYDEPFICVGNRLMMNVSSDRELESILWKAPTSLECADCPTAMAYPDRTYSYEVNTVDIDGCPGTSVVEVMAVENCGTYIPNVFSPNGDGQNDHFFVVSSTGASKVEKFKIFNRWGNLIYQKSNIEVGDPYEGWDGMINSNLAGTDVYVYIIEISFLDLEKPVVFKGDVLLKR